MVGRVILGAVVAVALAPSARAGHFHNGNQVLAMCRELEGDEISSCYAYLAGVVDAPAGVTLVNYCLPGGVSLRQLRDIAVRYLENHPETRHLTGGYLVALALQETFPCAARR